MFWEIIKSISHTHLYLFGVGQKMTLDYTEFKFNYKYKEKVVNKLKILNNFRHIKYSQDTKRK
jgi:hypothetical protein